MRAQPLAATLAVALATALPNAPSRAAAAPARGDHVLLISIDGLPWDTFELERARLPVLSALADRGVAGPSRTIFPSMTWPSHTSIITGALPRRHRVVGNRHWDRTRRRTVHSSSPAKPELVNAPTLYDVAWDAGLKTAGVLWAATQQAPKLHFNVPEVYGQRNFARGSTEGLLAELGAVGIPTEDLGRFAKGQMFLQDSAARDIAVHLVDKERPRLMLLHFLSVDTLSHRFGPRTRHVRWGLELIDRYIGDVLAAYRRAGLADRTNVLIVSDHGFHRIDKRLDADRLLHEAGLLKNLKRLDKNQVRTVSNGHALYVYVPRKAGRDKVVAQVRALLGARELVAKTYLPRHYAKLGLPDRATDERMPDLIVLSKPHAIFGKNAKDAIVGDSRIAGMHGYLPDHPEMWPAFVAAGPDIRKGGETPVQMHNLDVAPTAARLLGLTFPAEVDGKVREDLLKP